MSSSVSSQLEVVALVGLAAILAGLLGLEREAADKPAGFRTHMLTGGASALLILLGQPLSDYFVPNVDSASLRIEPFSIIQAIIVGVSFLGAGTILKSRNQVRNLTTAASLLFSAGIGIATALKLFYLAIGVTLIVFVITFVLSRVDDWMEARRQPKP